MRRKKTISRTLSQKPERERWDYYYNRPGSNPGTFQIPENAFPRVTIFCYE